MYFGMKNYLKSNRNHTTKQAHSTLIFKIKWLLISGLVELIKIYAS